MSISATLDNGSLAAVDARLAKVVGDHTALFRNVSLALEKNFNKRFNARIDPDGKAWMPWTDSTQEQRLRQKRGKLLEFSNPGMRHTVRRKFDRKGASLMVESPIAAYHEQQTPPKKGRLPRRAMLFSKGGGLGAMDQQSVESVTQVYFNQLMNK